MNVVRIVNAKSAIVIARIANAKEVVSVAKALKSVSVEKIVNVSVVAKNNG